MKPKLYQYAVCPFCSKVQSMLALKRVEYDTVEVHPLNKKQIDFSKDYRAVPIYIDSEGNQVNDSTAIMKHIDKEFPAFRVFASDPSEERWLAWSEDYVKSIPPLIYRSVPESLQAFNYITKAGQFSWFERRMIKFSGAFVMTLVAKKIRKTRGIENPETHFSEKVGQWAEGLSGKPFAGGGAPNGADVAVFGISRSVSSLPVPRKIFAANPLFKEWFARMSARTGLVVQLPI